MSLAFEARRKLVHILEGSIAAVLVWYGWFPLPHAIAGLAGLVFISLILRQRDLPLANYLHDSFGRDEHKDFLPAQGTIFLFAGIITVVGLFPARIALAGIIVVTLGDSTNTLVGKYAGSIPNPLHRERNIEGFIAAVTISGLFCLTVLPLHEAVIASTIGMVAEHANAATKERFQADDNFLIPVTVGAGLLLYVQFLSLL
ncbi:MAG: hypothetical protein SVU32_05630 [Candidatus Nanohaloarchaea archaeon]|nr:hypothetical protein [Candidatus Nanohaloarchaea archaeon]